MFEIKVIAGPINDLPRECECSGYAGTANNLDQPWEPVDPFEPILPLEPIF